MSITDKAYDPADGALLTKSTQKKFRESFAGTSLDATKWDVTVGSGMTVSVLNGELTVASGVDVNSETVITSKDTFTVPFRTLVGFLLTQRIANQDFILECVSADSMSDATDDSNIAGWTLNGTNNTVGAYHTRNVSSSGLLSATLSTINSTAAYSILEIEPFADECWFHSKALDSTNARTASAVRHRDIIDPDRKYKLRIRVKNGATAPASSTSLKLLFIACTDYMELTAEITAGRGGVSAGSAIPAYVTNQITTVTPVLNTSFGGSAIGTWVSAATTNANLVKAGPGAISAVVACNTSAAWKYLKVFNKATAPVPGTDTPIFNIGIPPGSSIALQLPAALRCSAGIGIAITGGSALLDATAVAVGDVSVSMCGI